MRRHSLLIPAVSRRTALGAGVGITVGLVTGSINRVVAQEGTPAVSPAAEDYPEVVITAVDYQLDLPATIPGGLTRLTLDNQGATDHHAMFMRVNEGSTLADLEAALTGPDFGPIFAASTSLGGPEVAAGLTATAIVDLTPGEYIVVCVIPGPDGIPHYMMGMQAPVEVTAAAAGAAPTSNATITLIDFGFEAMPMEATPGRHVWEITNGGEQLHEYLILRQRPGVTFDQVLTSFAPPPAATPGALVEATPAAAEPLYDIVGGAAPMSPGQTNWAVLDLEAGEHIAICFVPDPASGAPHFALGMIMPLLVG